MQAPPLAAKYAAFISYSHSDEATAKWLHRKLEAYRTPRTLIGRQGRHGAIQRRLGKVFRDREEFAAGGELTVEIQEALRHSASLIVLCSLKAAESQYVAAEIEFFRSLGRSDRIVPVILEGEPRDCYPVPLRTEDELLGADLRPARDGKDGGLLRLLAGLHGVGFDDLAQRERAAQRWRLRAAVGAVALFAVLAVAATVLGLAARRSGTLAEQRAALMSVDSARNQLVVGGVDEALLVLLDAARVLRQAPPDALLIAFQEALDRAKKERFVSIGSSARLFGTPNGVYAVSTDSGEVSLIQGDGTLKRIVASGKPVGAVLSDGDQGLIVVRDDLTIEHHAAARPPGVVGAFKYRGPSSGQDASEVAMVAPGLLLWQPVAISTPAAGDEYRIQVFDMATRKLVIVPAPRPSPVNYALLSNGRRVLFDTHGFVADIDSPPDSQTLRRLELREGPYPGFPSFERLAQVSCLAGIPEPSESQEEAVQTALDDVGAGGSLQFSCRIVGDSVLIGAERSTSAGINRADVLVDGYGARIRVESPTRDVDSEAPNITWAGISTLDNGDSVLAIAVNTRIRIKNITEDEVVFDSAFGYPIKFAGFLPDGKLLIWEDGRDQARILDYAQLPFASRSFDGEVGQESETALHSVACRDRPYSGLTTGGATMKIQADAVPDDYHGPLTFRVRINSTQTQFEKTFGSAQSQQCVAVAEGGRYLAVGGSGERMQIHDLFEAQAGRPSQIGDFAADAWGDSSSLGWSTIFFLGPGPTIIAASGGLPVQRWDYVESIKTWTSSEIYRGDLPVRSAEPDATGRRLLLLEDLDHGDVSARVYSLEAGRTWRDLGRDYKWLFALFNAKNEALVAKHHRWQLAAWMIGLDDAVRIAREELSEPCRSFSGESFRKSSCWPRALRQ